MTKTKTFKSKITIPILISMTVAIVIAFSMPQVEAGHTSIVTESSKTAEVGTIILYVGFIDQFVGLATTSYSVSCDSPATAGIAPTSDSGPGAPFVVKVSSSVAGTFDCTITAKQVISGPRAPTTHTDIRIVTSTFTDPPPPPIMCGPGTVPQGNECVQDPVVTQQIIELQSDLTDCQSQNAQLTSDLVQCEADKVTLNQQIINLQGIITGLESTIADLQSEIQNLLDILLSGEITICHKEKITQTIGLDAFGTHAGHGDTIGPCE